MEIVVLFGGDSEEREVSLRSGERVAGALREKGHDVLAIDWREGSMDVQDFSCCRRADAVFLALHGGAGEDGRLQKCLEGNGIFHYTGSSPEASALAMQKSRAKRVVSEAGVPVAKGALWLPGDPFPLAEFPCIVKPEAGGSSVGLRLLQDAADAKSLTSCVPLLCEEYLAGREFSVGVLDGAALPVIELHPVGGMYDYARKYMAGATEELCPAPITKQESAHLKALALVAFKAMGLCDYARIDFKEGACGDVCFLEANTLPGMTQTSLFPLAAAVSGIDFATLCEKMAEMARCKRR